MKLFIDDCCFFDIVDVAMLTMPCRYGVNIGTLAYLVYIFYITMLSISCQHRYPVIVFLSYILYIVDITLLTISCRYRVDIGTL